MSSKDGIVIFAVCSIIACITGIVFYVLKGLFLRSGFNIQYKRSVTQRKGHRFYWALLTELNSSYLFKAVTKKMATFLKMRRSWV
ncbi:hypothetical protein BDZ94DRAFT_1264698 [Collybia nuda]|uniref:Uncharacterized protein n=1 Tax=Collybia nuda TaxID=64659 RepID=A0A9P5Y494_9AGAR|nr:hypothetical protein BDZ94DRAFT_1264698 [Collybia nuda]